MTTSDTAKPNLSVTAAMYAECCLVSVSGRVDHTNSDDFLNDLSTHADSVPRGGAMVIDLSKLEFISSAGLRALLLAQKTVSSAQGKLIVCGVGGVVKEVFRISKFDALLNVQETVGEAMSQVSAAAAEAFSG